MLDISAASVTKSNFNLLPKPPPNLVIVTVILSSGIFNNFETAVLALPGVCVAPINSTASGRTSAKKFIGSIGLCGRNGHWYSLVTTLAAVLNAVSTSPSFLLTCALSLFISEENNWLWSAVL